MINRSSKDVSVIPAHLCQVTHSIPVGPCPQKMEIHDGYGYVTSNGSRTISIINLKTRTLIHTINWGFKFALDFSDTHFYLNTQKLPLPNYWLRLFKQPYSGIEELPTSDDADLAFEDFVRAALVADNEAAQKHFKIALANANRKAYAVAFHAFSLGLWGAPKDDKMALEFSTNADWDYYRNIEDYPWGFSLKSKD